MSKQHGPNIPQAYICLQGDTANEATKEHTQRKEKEKRERRLDKEAVAENNSDSKELSQDPTGSSNQKR